jgi:hypothetical protein
MDAKVKPWDGEAAYYVREGRMFDGDYEKARNFVVAKWLYWGDFRPLADAIRRGPLDDLVTGMMLHLIEVEGSHAKM